MNVGDKIVCHCPGSWTDGKVGTIVRLGIEYHLLQLDIGQTNLPECAIEVICKDSAANAREKP